MEDLRVYQEAVAIAEEIWAEVVRWTVYAKTVVGKQLVEAADSISANIAESYGRTGTRDVVNFLMYARGSLYETKDRLRKAVRRKLVQADRGQALAMRLESLAPALNAYITTKRRTLAERQKS